MKRISLNKVMAKLAEQDDLQLKEWQKQILEVELGEEVNLSSVKELNNYIKQLKKNNSSLSKSADKINSAIKKYNSAASELESISSSAQRIVSDLDSDLYNASQAIREFQESAREMGVSVNSVPQYKELLDLLNDQSATQLKRAISELRRINIDSINPLS